MNLHAELDKYRKLVDKELELVMPNVKTPQKIIFDSMRYSVFAGGKRLRPILLLKSCELLSGEYLSAMTFASAIELIHTYSLIHDDLPAMDDDNFRRGKPTNHKVYGEGIAILAGDGLLNYSYELMINSIQENKDNNLGYVLAFKEIAQSAGVYGMIGGQVVDLLSENEHIDKEKLNYIHLNKTSALIEAAVIAGALIGNSSYEELEALRKYARAIGLGYQIRDDILDILGDYHKLGKDIGSDVNNNKSTYISLYGLDNSIQKTKNLCDEAINALSIFDNNEQVIFFKELARYLVNREM